MCQVKWTVRDLQILWKWLHVFGLCNAHKIYGPARMPQAQTITLIMWARAKQQRAECKTADKMWWPLLQLGDPGSPQFSHDGHQSISLNSKCYLELEYIKNFK